ncbi:50S ribosomal protein L5 [Candidatus Saccharibacteria bacterium]|nr:50S ribosomal protein L5 [Candidatus Saccharibacteria bacterium]
MSRLQEKYQAELRSQLKESLGVANIHQVPKLTKIVVNTGVGRATQDSKQLEAAEGTLAKITGQKPIQTKARHSIAGFKLREGQAVGTKVTLRGERMYDFLDRVISIVLPRTRDFRGLSLNGFDPQGNYSIGLDDQSVFAEISFEDIVATHGLQISIVTDTLDRDASRALLQSLGLPFEKEAK